MFNVVETEIGLRIIMGLVIGLVVGYAIGYYVREIKERRKK